MTTIRYETTKSGDVKVFLDGRHSGAIKRDEWGKFAYWPKGQRRTHGPVFDSIESVKRDVEGR